MGGKGPQTHHDQPPLVPHRDRQDYMLSLEAYPGLRVGLGVCHRGSEAVLPQHLGVLTPVSTFGNSTPQQLEAMEWAESNAARADILTLDGNPGAGFHLLVNASHPFVLVFSQEYDPGWAAEVNGAPVPQQDHFDVYGYADGWLVNAALGER